MQDDNFNTFLSIHNATPIKIKTDLVDYAFSSKVIGMYRQWLIVDFDDAMEGFLDTLKPGIRLTVKYKREGIYYQFTAVLKRLILNPKPFLILGQPGPLENIERRKLPRLPCDFPGNMEVKRNIEMGVININEKGCRVRFSTDSVNINDFRKGDTVKLRIKIPERHTGFIVVGEIRERHAVEGIIEAGILFNKPPNALISYAEFLKNNSEVS